MEYMESLAEWVLTGLMREEQKTQKRFCLHIKQHGIGIMSTSLNASLNVVDLQLVSKLEEMSGSGS